MLNSTQSVGDDRLVAKCFVELGDITKEKGEYDDSLQYHRKSLEIFERIADVLGVADSHMNMAAVYKAKGELRQAMFEYEKGFALYEDFVTDDGYKSIDSGLDMSLNSSSFSDRQHIRTVSKSDEHLPQTTLIDFIDKNIQRPSNDMMNERQSTSDSFSISKTNSFLQSSINMDDSSLLLSENITRNASKPISPLNVIVTQYIDDDGNILSSSDDVFETQVERNIEKNHLIKRCIPCQTSIKPVKKDLLVCNTDTPLLNSKSIEANNHTKPANVHQSTISNEYQWHQFLNKQFMIIIAIILFSALIFWFLQNSSTKSRLLCQKNTFSMCKTPRVYQNDDLGEQLRKILPWRKDYIKSLDKSKRRTIEAFFTSSKNRTKMTVEKFQRILNMLDLKIVLTPR